MSTSYPGAIDNLTNPTGTVGETQSTVSHLAQHQNANDAIEAIEGTLGVNPQGAAGTVKARLDAAEAAITALGTSAYTSLPDGSITTAKLATNSVSTIKITDDSITAIKLQTDSVTTAKIVNNAVTAAKLATALTGKIMCTAATRPSGVASGQTIFETDTGRELMYDGTNWVIMSEPTQTFTPTFSGVTGGSPIYAGSYTRSSGWCSFTAGMSFFGTPSAISGLTLTLPITAYSLPIGALNVTFYDLSTTTSYLGVNMSGTTTTSLKVFTASGSYTADTAITNAIPFTFTNGDEIQVCGRYRMTTRYS